MYTRTIPTLINPTRLSQDIDSTDSVNSLLYPVRSPFETDGDKIVFSEGYRALADKTQVHDRTGATGVFRNRLTHSMEVSRVGRSLGIGVGAKMLNILSLNTPARGDAYWKVQPEDLGHIVSAACMAHDIGNPPFGHQGEDAISDFFQNNAIGAEACSRVDKTIARELRNHEGNAQGFRMITNSMGWRSGVGLNLTVATLAAFGKYPYAIRNSKKYGVHNADMPIMRKVAEHTGMHSDGKGGWIRHPLAWLMEAADDICYLTVDLEDAAQVGIISFDDVLYHFRLILSGDHIDQAHQMVDHSQALKYLRSQVVKSLISACVDVYPDIAQSVEAGTLDKTNGGGLVGHGRHGEAMAQIRSFSQEKIYRSPQLKENREGYTKQLHIAMSRLTQDLLTWLDTRREDEVLVRSDKEAGTLSKLACAVIGAPVPGHPDQAFPWLLDQVTLMSDADILDLAKL